jgi:hypothetical protein
MRPWHLALGLMVAVLVACGGGSGVGEGGTGSFVSGPISGFGSVIVGGVRFDDSSPTTTIEDEDSPGIRLERSALRLGLVVEVEGGPIDTSTTTPSATARKIRVGRAIVGPVTDVFPALRIVRVLGQPVRVSAATVFGSGLEGGITALAAEQVVEVNGFFGIDPDTGLPRFVATRFDKVSLPLPGDYTYKVRGIARNVDAQTFHIGDEVFDYSDIAASLPRRPETNRFVRARVRTTKDAQGHWIVTELDVGLPTLADVREAKLEGIVTDFVTNTQFSVNGIPVDASGVSPAATVAVGVRVEVEGRVSQGVLRADKVEVKTEDEVDNEDFELHGGVSGVNPTARTFVLTTESGLRTFTIVYDDNTRFENGSAVTLAGFAGRVEVKGLWVAATGRLLAREIKFE